MPTRLTYVMKFVADMDRAVAFHRDILGLTLRFQSPGWSEFDTGETTLALHSASDQDGEPAGGAEVGLCVDDLDAFYRDMTAKGVAFVHPPMDLHGARLARFIASEGGRVTVSG